ncbi:MAG: Abi family protein [Romboutsia sp.]
MTSTTLKDPKSFDEQIEILQSRGLIITDKENAKFVLSNLNYYRFSAYLLHAKNDNNTYKENTQFDDIYNIYLFDKKLRNILISLLESIEISFRTYIAYTLATKHGSKGYLDSENFKEEIYFNKFIETLSIEKTNHKNKAFIKHHNNKYHGELPIWVAVEIISFGSLSKLYSNMIPEDTTFLKQNLCSVNPRLIGTWLHSLSHLRNLCAHYGRIYNANLPNITIQNSDKKYNPNVKKVFAYILAIKKLIADTDTWNNAFIQLQCLFNDYKGCIDLDLLGFPEDWVNILSK